MARFFKVDNVVSNEEAKSLDASTTTQTILQELRQGMVKAVDPMSSEVLVEEQTMEGTIELKARPLLRGLVDQPDVGSAVVLIDFESPGKKTKSQVMYLGPINTEDNATKNRMQTFLDVYNTPAYKLHNRDKGGIKFQEKYTEGEPEDSSRWRFDFPKVVFSHLGKVADFLLDFPKDQYNKYRIPPEKHVTAPIGDMFMQGKFGNSIRLGQRYNKPNIIISNGRPPGTVVESFNDTSTIMLTQTGPLRNHLGHTNQDGRMETSEFVSAVEGTENTKRTNLVKDYQNGQIFIQSDRIIFNTKIDNVYISSATTIDLNSMQNINLSTPKDTVIDSENIYLGRAAIENSNPAVLGNELNEILNEILSIVESLSFIEYGNMPILYNGAPVNPTSFQNLRNKIDRMMSQNVFIEPNIEEG